MNVQQLFSLIRQMLTVFGVLLASNGIDVAVVDTLVTQLEVVVGASMALGSTVWSLYVHFRPRAVTA